MTVISADAYQGMKEEPKNNLKENTNIPYESFIGGWYLPKDMCNDLIDYFWKNKDHHTEGMTGQGVVKKNVKDSTDLTITPQNMDYPMYKFRAMLQCCIDNYQHKFSRAAMINRYDLINYNFQYYRPGGGFKTWHCERGHPESSLRVLAFQLYLNDVESGGTEFEYQNLKLNAEQGLCVIWPADWTHTHRGIIANQDKYIITGWFEYKQTRKSAIPK
tara:strand:- start:550 stop:1200 length:651 start_codon:yes stop_codon:yes gene_type:complete